MAYIELLLTAAVDGTRVPYFPNAGESQKVSSYKNCEMRCSLLCIGIVNSQHCCFLGMEFSWPGRSHDKTCTEYYGVQLFLGRNAHE